MYARGLPSLWKNGQHFSGMTAVCVFVLHRSACCCNPGKVCGDRYALVDGAVFALVVSSWEMNACLLA